MGTIIAHGKSQWGRANKHKRVDEELERELNASPKAKTLKHMQNTDLAGKVSEMLDVGEVFVKKIDGESQLSSSDLPQKRVKEKTEHVPQKVKPIEPSQKIETKIPSATKTPKKKVKNNDEQGLVFVEDIDGWEEKIRLLNEN